jgi:hypothetical protein
MSRDTMRDASGLHFKRLACWCMARDTYHVHSFNHLGDNIWLNQRSRDWVAEDTAAASVTGFHQQLPGYAVTPFHELAELRAAPG